VLSSIGDRDLDGLLKGAQKRAYGAQAVILHPGERGDGLYLVLSGVVELVLDDGQGREIVMDMLEPPAVFGEGGLLGQAAKAASARAQQACELLHLPRQAVLAWLERDASASLAMAKWMASRLAQAHEQLADLAFVDVYGRVARMLLDQSTESEGSWSCDTPCAQLAAMVGASREMVSRVIGYMVADGALRREKRRLVLLDRSALFARTLEGQHAAAGTVLRSSQV
jgi:CRP/FNR family transcriptional regulator, cyclic AMP receptor protein